MRLPMRRSMLRLQHPVRFAFPSTLCVRNEHTGRPSKLGEVVHPRRGIANEVKSESKHEQAVVKTTPEKELEVLLPDDLRKKFPLFWLRDHCPCPECLHPKTKQRLLDTFAIPPNVRPAFCGHDNEGVEITWDHGAHQSSYPWPWLRAHSPFTTAPPAHRWTHVKPTSPFPSTPYLEIMSSTSDAGLAHWLNQIRESGFSFVSDCPVTPATTEALLTRIAFIRPTHYGAFWDFTSSANPTDTAYTNLGLPVHTDTTYFTDPCGLQMFHLLSHTNGSGGASTLVDGFAAAEYLYAQDAMAYRTLCRRIVSHASGDARVGSIDNTAMHELGFPVLEHTASDTRKCSPGSLKRVRWNNDDRAIATRWKSTALLDGWYAAARKWTEVLRMKDFEIEVQLEPGRPVIFDNWRMLHGRRAFTGDRRVCGGYIGMDDFLARWRSVNGDSDGPGDASGTWRPEGRDQY